MACRYIQQDRTGRRGNKKSKKSRAFKPQTRKFATMGDEMDEESRDSESLNWSHTTEDRAAFKSILGVSGMSGVSESHDKKKRADYFTVVALADDVSMSTIANETLDGTILHSRFIERPPPPPPPLPPPITGNTTPPKKTKKKDFAKPPKKQINSLDLDDATLPETPQSEHGQKQFNTEEVSKMRQLPSNDPYRCSPGMKRGICIASIIGCIILGAIGVLSYTLYDVRSEPESSTRDNLSSNVDGPNEEEEQTLVPSTNLRTSSPTQSPTTYSAEGPSSSKSPTQAPPILNFQILLEVVSLISPNSTEALNNASSAQHMALQWLSIDPNLSEYSKERIVQRWAMATFFLSMPGEYASNGRAMQMDAEENSWMTYSDECTWYSTQRKSSCSDDGKLLDIHLEDIGLSGVLPPEISLLSDSLGKSLLFVSRSKRSPALSYLLPSHWRRANLSFF